MSARAITFQKIPNVDECTVVRNGSRRVERSLDSEAKQKHSKSDGEKQAKKVTIAAALSRLSRIN